MDANVAVHCTGGDLLIAVAALSGALLVAGHERWLSERYTLVSVAAKSAGVAWVVFSEWLNTEVRGAWAYSGWMPTLPVIGTGLAPLMQWLAIPPLALFWARRRPTGQAGASFPSA